MFTGSITRLYHVVALPCDGDQIITTASSWIDAQQQLVYWRHHYMTLVLCVCVCVCETMYKYRQTHICTCMHAHTHTHTHTNLSKQSEELLFSGEGILHHLETEQGSVSKRVGMGRRDIAENAADFI